MHPTDIELSTVQAAKLLGIAEQTVRDHIHAGRLPARRHGLRPRYKIQPDDLRRFAEQYSYLLDEARLARYLAAAASPAANDTQAPARA